MARIAVRVPNWVGDTVMATPALAHLRANFPDAEITAIGRGSARAVLENNPHIDNLWIVDDRGIGNVLRLAARLRADRFDLGVLLPNSFHSALPFALGGVKRRVGYARDGRRLLLTHPIQMTPFHAACHEVEYYLNVLTNVGVQPVEEAERNLILRPTDEAREKVTALLDQRGLGRDRLLAAISPGAFFGSSKCWLPDRFAQVADRMTADYGATVVILGAPNEAPLCREIADLCQREVHDLGPDVDLAMLIALCERLGMFITNDCGAMHIAAAMRTPLVAIFGPTDPRRTRPFDPEASVVERIDTCGCDIAPCYKPTCPIEHQCMTEVEVPDVMQAVERQIERLKASS